ncbi:MAG: ROK family protein [Solirubrobacterales bacterium]
MARPDAPLRGGIDLGGTKIQAIVADADHEILGAARRPTPTTGGPPDVIDALAGAMRDACADAGVDPAQLAGVGLGSPGDVDAAAGTIAQAGNLPDWRGPVPVGELLGRELGATIALGNDVSVATRAEFELGAGRPYRSVLGVFWGTGVGGGLILDGREWQGRGAAGEIGHIVVRRGGAPCPCGRRGCMEAYAGRKAMELEARRRHDDGEHTDLFKIMKERDRDRLTSGVWERALKHGDKLAEQLFHRAYAALGAGVASAINLLDVEAVVLGGGLGVRFGDDAARRLAEAMHPHLFNDHRPPAVAVAALGDDGGALGAAMLVAG